MGSSIRLVCAIFFLGFFSLKASWVSAQQLSEEPAGGMDEISLEESAESLPPSSGIIPEALKNYPSALYYRSWDTMAVRRYADPPVSIADSIYISLVPEGTNDFVFPKNGQLLSPFGYRGRRVHAGVDIKLNLGDSVNCAFDGIVRMARYYAGYGNCVVVRHYNGLETLYGHLSKIKVNVNQVVSAGDLIGLGGRTGRATCNHLHFETRFKGMAFNPKQLINFETFSLLNDTLVVTGKTFGRTRDYLPGTDHLLASKDSRTDFSTHKSAKHPSAKKKYHTVKQGDTLYALSRKYNTTVKQICALNGIKSTKILKLGSRVRVR
jgi:murein DD-endopeptidase MepM/ murein hydrolase activator NlpD